MLYRNLLVILEYIDKYHFLRILFELIVLFLCLSYSVQNYILLNHQEELRIFELPLLTGFSRKSMIYRPLNTTPEAALNGTTVLNTIALTKGASILRVHDVKEAVECCKITSQFSPLTSRSARSDALLAKNL